MKLHLTPSGELSCFLLSHVNTKRSINVSAVHTGHVSNVGVPRVLKCEWIRANSLPSAPESNSLSPLFRNISATTHPAAHRSSEQPYAEYPNNSSGALYDAVPTSVILSSAGSEALSPGIQAMPRSAR